jgi:universal stress protein F
MKRILVGLDGSPRAPAVLLAASDLAGRLGAELLLFRAVGLPVEVPRAAYALSPDALADLLRDEARKYLEEQARDVPEGRIAGLRVAIGTPWQAICEAAASHDIDLVVIGSHGYGGLDRVLGTTAAKVVNHADRSVLVVRAPERLGG